MVPATRLSLRVSVPCPGRGCRSTKSTKPLVPLPAAGRGLALRRGAAPPLQRGLTVIKTCCQAMMWLGRHPGEAEALATLRGAACLDRAHLERGNTLHLGTKGQASVTDQSWCYLCPQSWGQLGSALPPERPGLASSAASRLPSWFSGYPPACQPCWEPRCWASLTLQIRCLWRGPSRREQRRVRTGTSSLRSSLLQELLPSLACCSPGPWLGLPVPAPSRPVSQGELVTR